MKGDIMMDTNTKKTMLLQAQQAQKKLEANGFAATILDKKEDVLPFLKKEIPEGSSIGIGGSATLTQCGVLDWLTGNEKYNFLDRYHTDDPRKIFLESLGADVYLTSTNALTMDGKLYNVDGNGNRVAAIVYGPAKVIVVTGVNKIVKDLDAAIERVEMLAAPINNARLKRGNPCEMIGSCVHCNKETSICNQFLVTRRCSPAGRIHVVIVNEFLGF